MTLTDDIPINEPWPFETEADQLVRLHDGLAALKPEQTRWLLAQGVPARALVWPDALRRGRVVFMPAGRFEFEPDYRGDLAATEAVLTTGYDPDGTPADLIAWCPRSGRIGSWLNRAPWFGDAFGPRCSEGLALAVHETPLQWLRAARAGVVLIEAAPGLCRQLDGSGPFVATGGPRHALRLEKLTTPTKPRILISNLRIAS